MPPNGDVRTAVIPAAGLGTRMLPATKSIPKELLPLVDRPIVQYGVEEAVRSGVRRITLVTNPGNTLSASHFASHPALERALAESGRTEALAAMRELAAMAEVTTVHQDAPLGLGHAVLCGRPAVGDAPFAVMLPDDVIDADPPALRRMIDVFTDVGGPVVLVERVPHSVVHRYGVIAAEPLGGGVHRVTDLVEKPAPDEAPSDLAIVGRYVLTPDTFAALEATGTGAGGEIQLTDGLRRLLRQRPVYAWELEGTRLDAGTPTGFLGATLHFALKRPDLAAVIEETLGVARGVVGRRP
ncbi:MAG: UTP--glucose-1-phosphate uridylyltransferase [Acidobacteria bacterium]|nr:UTP--glucose-1-phosphate uridylyltransferase [Acidobacteriota bacterium]